MVIGILLVVAVEAPLARLLAAVAVLLLVDAVELQELRVAALEGRRVRGQVLHDRPAECAAGLLDPLDLRGFGVAAARQAHG